MNDNAFLPENPAPDEAAIAAALGPALPRYRAVLEAADGYEREWKHHGPKYGWKLKLHDGDKALAEITVASEGFLVALAARALELEELREDPELEETLAALMPDEGAKGGWGLRVAVTDDGSLATAVLLVKALAALREGGRL
ncbi:MAG: DUF3788 family protein [Spirochaetales bacterium]|nr:DUF3788 family protein [Spirochaetales bacterium]